MCRHRHDPERRSGQHHGDQIARYSASFRDKFGLAGMGEAHCVKPRFRDGPGHECGRGSRSSEAYGKLERIQGVARTNQIEAARRNCRVSDPDNRQRGIEVADRLARLLDRRDWTTPNRLDRGGIAYGEKRRQALLPPTVPAFRDDFRTDPRRIAERDGDRLYDRLNDSRSPHPGADRADSAGRAGWLGHRGCGRIPDQTWGLSMPADRRDRTGRGR